MVGMFEILSWAVRKGPWGRLLFAPQAAGDITVLAGGMIGVFKEMLQVRFLAQRLVLHQCCELLVLLLLLPAWFMPPGWVCKVAVSMLPGLVRSGAVTRTLLTLS